jgi:hypothetical protein
VVKTSVDTCLSRSGLLSVGEASGAKTGGRNRDFFVLLFLQSHRKNKKPFSFSNAMAKRKSRGMKIQPAVTDLFYTIPAGSGEGARTDTRSYIDTARSLSRVNRRLYEQGKMYAYQGLTFIWRQSGSSLASIELSVRTAGNTWVVQNAHTKGKALWHEMQDLVLKDNPSVKGKWHDYKVRLSTQQVTARELEVKDSAGNNYVAGEWLKSTYVMPQHDVDPATGLPLAADEFTACLIGPSSGTIQSLVQAYQDSRATVQPIDPNVPANMSTSFFNLLTDSGSQEPELADVIEDENDQPPYAVDDYPGSDANAPVPCVVGYGAISTAEVDGRIGPFVAPCGLLEINVQGYDSNGAEVDVADMPAIDILLHVAPGTYKGVAAIPMGQ